MRTKRPPATAAWALDALPGKHLLGGFRGHRNGRRRFFEERRRAIAAAFPLGSSFGGAQRTAKTKKKASFGSFSTHGKGTRRRLDQGPSFCHGPVQHANPYGGIDGFLNVSALDSQIGYGFLPHCFLAASRLLMCKPTSCISLFVTSVRFIGVSHTTWHRFIVSAPATPNIQSGFHFPSYHISLRYSQQMRQRCGKIKSASSLTTIYSAQSI